MSKRRALLRALSIAGGAAAVETWKKPVVGSVILPAHAQTSLCTLIAVNGLTITGTHCSCGSTVPNPNTFFPFTIAPGNVITIGPSQLTNPLLFAPNFIGVLEVNIEPTDVTLVLAIPSIPQPDPIQAKSFCDRSFISPPSSPSLPFPRTDGSVATLTFDISAGFTPGGEPFVTFEDFVAT